MNSLNRNDDVICTSCQCADDEGSWMQCFLFYALDLSDTARAAAVSWRLGGEEKNLSAGIGENVATASGREEMR